MDIQTPGDRLRKARLEKKLNQKQLSKKTGVGQSSISDFENGKKSMAAESLHSIAVELGVTSEWILTGASASKFKVFDLEKFKKQHHIIDDENAVSFKPAIKPVLMGKRWVPVKAYSKMGMDGYFTDMGYDGNGGDGYVPTHSGGSRAFGIRGTGDSMFPAIRNGWFVVCDPDAEPVPTEFVQVCLKDGRCTIKEFLGINGGVLSLLAVNGGERFSFDMDEVESITAITDIIPPSQHRQEHPQAPQW